MTLNYIALRTPWAATAGRLLLFSLLWLVLTDAATSGLPFGLAAAAAATVLSLRRGSGDWPLRPLGWLRFAPWFVARSLAGGWDVLLRALRPARPLAPDWVTLELRLRTPAARHLLAATVSLLPGTLAARMDTGALNVHVLDRELPVTASLRELERRIGDLFGEELPRQ